MVDKLVKSKERVRDFGEIFTPEWMVDLMLNQGGLEQRTFEIATTFFEPSAGEGAFLVEILRRKLLTAAEISTTKKIYDENALIALTSIYGIELLEDNVEQIVMNLIVEFLERYTSEVTKSYDGKVSTFIKDSAKTIIKANIVQGNSLTKVDNLGNPLIFSEWKSMGGSDGNKKVQRTEYTFDSILQQGGPTVTVKRVENEEIDLLAGFFEDEPVTEPKLMNFLPVKYVEIGKELVGE